MNPVWRVFPDRRELLVALAIGLVAGARVLGLTALVVAYLSAALERLGFKRFVAWLRIWWDESAGGAPVESGEVALTAVLWRAAVISLDQRRYFAVPGGGIAVRGSFLVGMVALLPGVTQPQLQPADPSTGFGPDQTAARAAPRPGDAPPTSASPEESMRNRHLGFFLRVDVGLGYLGSSTTATGIYASLSDLALPLGVAVGGAVTENLVLAGDLWWVLAPAPRVKVDMPGVATADSSATVGVLGANLTYYFMPANVYVSASPSMTVGTLKSPSLNGQSRLGFGGRLAVGKEWWVAEHLGLGVAAQFLSSINKDGGPVPPTVTTIAGGVGPIGKLVVEIYKQARPLMGFLRWRTKHKPDSVSHLRPCR